ncbi:RICIN domain-containing protein [Streptomyces sp. NPDC055966]|uniref:RICIN domain-containing protein n=1 Tax=Streptomyces sp. NPDC055966 TaxID=3345669 RepID=UPI0035E29465
MTDSAIDRRRFLTAAALTAGASALPGGPLSGRALAAVPPQITLPERGIHDTSPASAWTDGFLTGNGEFGAVLHGAPALEKVVFNHHRLVLPNGTRDVNPPVISGRLEGARDKALAGDYAGANRDFAAGWSLRWTQAYHPAYELHIDTPGMTTVNDYARVGAWPLHEINPEDAPSLVRPAKRALELRGDQNISAHGSLHRALAWARLKDGGQVYGNLRKILGNNMVFKSPMTSHNPNLDIYNADAANAVPGVLAEALVYSRPGVLEILPALPDQLPKGTITGVRARGRIRIHSFAWDLNARTATLSVTSDVDQDVTLISRRGMTSVATTATVTASSLGTHARKVSLTAGQRTDITVSLLSGFFRLENRRSGKVLDVTSGTTADGADLIQWGWSGSENQQWRLQPDADGSFRLVARHSGKVVDSPGGSGQGAQLIQWPDGNSDNQHWKVVDAGGGHVRLVNVRNGLCADVEGGSADNGAKVIQWPVGDGTNQQWRLLAL